MYRNFAAVVVTLAGLAAIVPAAQAADRPRSRRGDRHARQRTGGGCRGPARRRPRHRTRDDHQRRRRTGSRALAGRHPPFPAAFAPERRPGIRAERRRDRRLRRRGHPRPGPCGRGHRRGAARRGRRRGSDRLRITPVPGLDDPEKVVKRTRPVSRTRTTGRSGTSTPSATARTWPADRRRRLRACTGVAPASGWSTSRSPTTRARTSLSACSPAIDWAVRNARATDATSACSTSPSAPRATAATRTTRWPSRSSRPGSAASSSSPPPATADRVRRRSTARPSTPTSIAVGAEDTVGTVDQADDGVAEFSSRGTAQRAPDVIAPGVGIISLRVPAASSTRSSRRRGSARRVPRQRHLAVRGRRLGRDRRCSSSAPGLSPDELKAVLRAAAGRSPAPTRRCRARAHRRGRRRGGPRSARAQSWPRRRIGGGLARPRRPRPRARGRAPRRQPLVARSAAGAASRWSASRWSRQPLVRQPLVRQPLVRQSLAGRAASRWTASSLDERRDGHRRPTTSTTRSRDARSGRSAPRSRRRRPPSSCGLAPRAGAARACTCRGGCWRRPSPPPRSASSTSTSAAARTRSRSARSRSCSGCCSPPRSS